MTTGAGIFSKAATHLDRLIFAIATLAAISSLLAMFVALGLEVVVRYITSSGLGWSTELPNLLFPWLIMSGVVLAAQRGQHIAVTALLSILGKGSTRALLIVLQLVLVVVFSYLTYVGIEVIEVTGTEIYPVTGVSSKWAYMALVVGFGGIALTSLTTIVHLLMASDPNTVRAHVMEADL